MQAIVLKHRHWRLLPQDIKWRHWKKELREYLLYTGQVGFYEDMMKERRNIRAARLREAARKAEAKRLWTDIIALIVGGSVMAFIIGGTITFISSYS